MSRTGRGRRLFIALWPTAAVRTALTATCRPVLRACAGRPVPPRHYHLTLAFLGECAAPPAGFDGLEQIMTDPVTGPADVPAGGRELVLDRFGYWRGPRVLWIGPARCPDWLTGLTARLRAGLDELGIGYDRRDFNAHLTLARQVTVSPELPVPKAVHWTVREFVLVESTSGPRGPVYEVLRRFRAGSRHEPNRH